MIASAQRPSSSFNVFKPDNKPLLVRGTLGDVFETSSNKGGFKVKRSKKLLSDVPPPAIPPLESNLNLPTQTGAIISSRTESRMGSRFGAYSQASFFSRHNPHPSRVRHIKGLNGAPICAVHDQGFFPLPRISINQPSTRERENLIKTYISSSALGINSTSFPINTITGLQHYPFKEKAVPRIGLIPITDTWRSELREFCSKAGLIADELAPPPPPPKQTSQLPSPVRKTTYSAETGRIIPPPSRAMSRHSARSYSRLYDHYAHITSYPDTETLMLEMLCQILQTDSVPSVQQWLVSAGDREKSLVLDMIKTAMNNEEELLQQQENQAPVVIATPLPPSRAMTARSEDRPGSMTENCDIDQYNQVRRSRSALSSRHSLTRSSGKRTPLGTPSGDKQVTMRFNKGLASLQKFSPLPKIDEDSAQNEQVAAPNEVSNPETKATEVIEPKQENS